jgi:hypothetical protein
MNKKVAVNIIATFFFTPVLYMFSRGLVLTGACLCKFSMLLTMLLAFRFKLSSLLYLNGVYCAGLGYEF